MKHFKKLSCTFLIALFLAFPLSSCSNTETATKNVPSSGLKVSFIDVGQGDSELIQVNGKNILIDSGPNDSRQKLLNYLEEQNIKKLNYVIATHPDEDHIGNMDDVIDKYDIETFIAPKKVSNTRAFESMADSLKKKNMKIDVPKPTDELDLGKQTKAEIIAPNSESYADTNNYSVVLKITYGDTRFLFTGDAEKESESEMLENGYDLKSDVLKVGHHGSSTSTSEKFLDKVNPEIAVISCGRDNKYGHPNKKTVNRLNKKNIRIYRTDVDGTIVLTSNGAKISRQ